MKNTLTIADLSKLVRESSTIETELKTLDKATNNTQISVNEIILSEIEGKIKASMEALRNNGPENENSGNVIQVDFVNKKRIE